MRFCPNLKQLSDTLTEVRHEAVQIMEEKRLLNLPVTMNGHSTRFVAGFERPTGLALTAPPGPCFEGENVCVDKALSAVALARRAFK